MSDDQECAHREVTLESPIDRAARSPDKDRKEYDSSDLCQHSITYWCHAGPLRGGSPQGQRAPAGRLTLSSAA
jgi:hypothetical protein